MRSPTPRTAKGSDNGMAAVAGVKVRYVLVGGDVLGEVPGQHELRFEHGALGQDPIQHPGLFCRARDLQSQTRSFLVRRDLSLAHVKDASSRVGPDRYVAKMQQPFPGQRRAR